MAHRGGHRAGIVWQALGLLTALAAAGCSTSVREQGDELLSAGRPTEAIKVWEQALAKTPRDTKLLTRIATAQTRLRQLDAAEATLMRAVALAPQSPRVRQNLALVYLKQKKLDKALGAFGEVLKLQETYPYTHYYIGLIHEIRGDAETARKHYVREVNHGACLGAWDRIWTLNRKAERRKPNQRGIFVFSVAMLAVAAAAYGLRVYLEVRHESAAGPPSERSGASDAKQTARRHISPHCWCAGAIRGAHPDHGPWGLGSGPNPKWIGSGMHAPPFFR